MTAKGASAHWNAVRRMATSTARSRRKNAVSQGKREILRDWSGQLHHLSPPSVGIAGFARIRLLIPRAGVGAKGRSRRPECGASRYANNNYGKDSIFMTTALRLEAYAGISALSFLRKLTETWKRVILVACGPFPDSKGGG